MDNELNMKNEIEPLVKEVENTIGAEFPRTLSNGEGVGTEADTMKNQTKSNRFQEVWFCHSTSGLAYEPNVLYVPVADN